MSLLSFCVRFFCSLNYERCYPLGSSSNSFNRRCNSGANRQANWNQSIRSKSYQQMNLVFSSERRELHTDQAIEGQRSSVSHHFILINLWDGSWVLFANLLAWKQYMDCITCLSVRPVQKLRNPSCTSKDEPTFPRTSMARSKSGSLRMMSTS